MLLFLPSIRMYAEDVPSITSQNSLTVEVTPLPRDQTGAFFEGRGFSPALSTKIASACVMKVVVRNTSASAIIHNSLADWRIQDKAHEQPLRLEADWQKAWARERAVPQSAKIAFRYAMLPTAETLNPGDWLQGLVTADLAPGSHFDLRIAWTDNDQPKQAWLRGLRCAP